MKVSVYVGMSVDGFIARRDGDVAWLHEVGGELTDEQDYGYQAFMDSIDVLVMGRKTFEQVLTFVAAGDDWPYGDKRVVVISSSAVTIPPQLQPLVETSSLAPAKLLLDSAVFSC